MPEESVVHELPLNARIRITKAELDVLTSEERLHNSSEALEALELFLAAVQEGQKAIELPGVYRMAGHRPSVERALTGKPGEEGEEGLIALLTDLVEAQRTDVAAWADTLDGHRQKLVEVRAEATNEAIAAHEADEA